MANEITVSCSMSLRNPTNSTPRLVDSYNSGSKQFDQTTKHADSGTVEIGTSEENLSFKSDMVDPGYAVFENLGTTDIDLGVSATTPTLAKIATLEAGQVMMVPLVTSATVRAIAITSASTLYFQVYDR